MKVASNGATNRNRGFTLLWGTPPNLGSPLSRAALLLPSLLPSFQPSSSIPLRLEFARFRNNSYLYPPCSTGDLRVHPNLLLCAKYVTLALCAILM